MKEQLVLGYLLVLVMHCIYLAGHAGILISFSRGVIIVFFAMYGEPSTAKSKMTS